MILDLSTHIVKIKALIEEDTQDSILYAALLSRLCLEAICYEKFRINFQYIPLSELRGWTPKRVMETLLEQVDDKILSGQKLYISDKPVEEGAELSELDYTLVGESKALNIRLINKLWNALSNVALHVEIPKGKKERVIIYRSSPEVKNKVNSALSLLEEIGKSSIVMSAFGPEVTFTCACGSQVKRKASMLKNGQRIDCWDVNCDETYTVQLSEQGISFDRRMIKKRCECGKEVFFPMKKFEALSLGKVLEYLCDDCGAKTVFQLKLFSATV